jgi:uncharacterized protein
MKSGILQALRDGLAWRTNNCMQGRLHVISLGVESIARARAFYCEGLGFAPCQGTNAQIVFLDAGGVIIALYGRSALAKEVAQATVASPEQFGGIALARNVASKSDVNALLERARGAGASILKPAQDAAWGGYAGYFADLDGHPWEVAYNPKWALTAADCITLEHLVSS